MLLVLLISWGKIQPFLAFLVSSSVAAVLLGLPIDKVPGVLEKGIGNILGGLLGIVCIGAMFGKLVANSGAAQKIAMVLMRVFGEKNLTWALMFTGFLVGIPLFYNVGFVLLVPLVFSVVQQTKMPPIYLGIPLFASLSVTHGYLPPHPAPTAMLPLFGADMGRTLFYGIMVALPAMICAGPLYARLFRNVKAKPDHAVRRAAAPRGRAAQRLQLLRQRAAAGGADRLLHGRAAGARKACSRRSKFWTNPLIVMLLGAGRGHLHAGPVARHEDAAAHGRLRQLGEGHRRDPADHRRRRHAEGGVRRHRRRQEHLRPADRHLHRSAGAGLADRRRDPRVAGLGHRGRHDRRRTHGAGGAPTPHVDPSLMVLAIGAGSLMFSHVNDSGFWMAKEYFNLSIKETILSWTLMEGIVGIVGIIGVLTLEAVLY